jgi:hypothetical protein
VYECTVVIRPQTTPIRSSSAFTSGARQLVVQEAFEMTVSSLEILVVDAEYHRAVHILVAGRRDDYLLRAGRDVRACLSPCW